MFSPSNPPTGPPAKKDSRQPDLSDLTHATSKRLRKRHHFLVRSTILESYYRRAKFNFTQQTVFREATTASRPTGIFWTAKSLPESASKTALRFSDAQIIAQNLTLAMSVPKMPAGSSASFSMSAVSTERPRSPYLIDRSFYFFYEISDIKR
jgi:hypothetical protein